MTASWDEGSDDGDPWWWWLRSPGSNGNDAANVDDDGWLNRNGNNVHNSTGGVRPASPHSLFWLVEQEQGHICADLAQARNVIPWGSISA